MSGCPELDALMTLASELDVRIGLARVGEEYEPTSPRDEEFVGALALVRSRPGEHEFCGGYAFDDRPGGLAEAARALHENLRSLVREKEPR